MKNSNPLIFIHGFKGAVLTNEAGRVHWITGRHALGLSSPPLALPLDLTKSDGLVPRQILRAVSLIPGVIEEKVYRPFLDAAEASGRPFHEFAYDWRRDCLETLDRFEIFMTKLHAKYDGQKITVAAHSMGGLLTMALLNRRPELFARVIFVGVPFDGGVGFLEDLHAGISSGLNRRILAPEILFTFPSVYTLFPLSGAGLSGDGHQLAMDFFSAADWERQRLGVFATRTPEHNLRRAFLGKVLQRAKTFLELLPPGNQNYPPVTVVLGRSQPTLATVVRKGPKSVRGWDFKSARKAPGDGRVRASHALAPAGLPYQVVESKAGHGKQLCDPRIIALILSGRTG